MTRVEELNGKLKTYLTGYLAVFIYQHHIFCLDTPAMLKKGKIKSGTSE